MSNPKKLQERLAEAARYALLRRLTPAIRHNMAGALQPVSMMSAMLEKRLQKPEPDFLALAKNSHTLTSLSREAGQSCVSLMGWFAPKDNEPVPLAECLADAIGLVTTELSFKGFSVVNETGGVEARLPPSVVRNVFMAALISLTDHGAAPAKVVLSAQKKTDEVVLDISLVAAEGEGGPGSLQAYRSLEWEDVAALAEFESVSLTHSPVKAELRCRLA